MSPLAKALIIGTGAAFMGHVVANTFTGVGDTENEKLMWRVLAGAGTGALLWKVL